MASKPNVITAAQLVALGACHDQVALFRKTFGASVEIVLGMTLPVGGSFDFLWAADNLLTPKARRAYDAAMAEAWRAYDAAMAEPRRAYDAARAEAFVSAFLSQENHT